MTTTPSAPNRSQWAGTLTDRERFNRQMHFLPVDRCFNMEFGFWEENFREWPLFVAAGVKSNSAARAFFSFDPSNIAAVSWT